MRSTVAGHQKETMTNWEQSSKLILLQLCEKLLLQLCEKLLKNSTPTILWLFGIWSKLERWKGSVSGCFMTWIQIKKKKKSLFWSLIFSYSIQQWTITQSNCDMQLKVDFIQQLAMTNSVVGPRRSSKAHCKATLACKKGHGDCLVVCCQCHPLQLSESWWNYHIREVCSVNHWNVLKTAMPASSIGQQKGPNSSPWKRLTICHTTNASKVERIALLSFASSAIFIQSSCSVIWVAIFIWPLSNWLPFLTTSSRENPSTTNRRQKMLSKSSLNLQAQIFMLQE